RGKRVKGGWYGVGRTSEHEPLRGAGRRQAEPGERHGRMGNSMLQRRQSAITPVGDEHVTWSMGEGQGRFCLHDHRLRCDPTGPEHWDLSWRHGDRIAEVRLL